MVAVASSPPSCSELSSDLSQQRWASLMKRIESRSPFRTSHDWCPRHSHHASRWLEVLEFALK